MKRIILFLFLNLILSSGSFAQFSVKGGINSAKLSASGSSSLFSGGGQSKRGILFGINNKFHLSDFVSFRPGIQYSTKGDKVVFSTLDFSNHLRYLEVPIDVVYTTGRLSVHTGPYLAYLLTATNGDQNIKEGFSPIDMGLNVGLAVTFNDFGIGMNYGEGLLNISKNNGGNTNVKNRVISLYLTYTQY